MGQTEAKPITEFLASYHQTSSREVDKNGIEEMYKDGKSGNLVFLRKYSFDKYEEFQFKECLKQHQKRKEMKDPNLQAIRQLATAESDCTCTKNLEIWSLWQGFDHNLEKQIQNRAAISKKFKISEIVLLMKKISRVFTYLQDQEVYHGKLRSSNIYLDNNGQIFLSDPLSLIDLPNFRKIASRRFKQQETQNIYISPDECESLQNSSVCLKSYKDDIWTFGMILLECTELNYQSICYRNQNTKINWNILEQRVDKVEKNYSAAIADVLKNMLSRARSQRKSWSELSAIMDGIGADGKTIMQHVKSPPNTGRFASIPEVQQQNQIIYNAYEDRKIMVSPLKSRHTSILGHTPSPQNPIGIPVSHSIYSHKFNFTYSNPHQPIPQIFEYNQPIQYHHQQAYSNPKLTQTKYIQQGENYNSAGYYLVNSDKQNSFNQNNISGDINKNQAYNFSAKNEYVSPMSRQGYLFSHLQHEGDSSSDRMDKSNPYFPKQLIMSINKQKQKQKQKNQNNPTSSNQSPIKDTYQPSIKQKKTSKQDSEKPSDSLLECDISQMHKNTKKCEFKSAESIHFENYNDYLSKNTKESILLEKIQMENQKKEEIKNQELEFVTEKFEQGSLYEGQKMGNMRHGKGKFYYQDGGHYDGYWVKNKMSGFGKLYYQSGNIAYEGYWVDDQFQGRGTLYNDQPEKLPADFCFDYRDFDEIGQIWSYYEGQFKNDLKKGRGKFMLSNGEYYTGDFDDDLIHGNGVFYGKNGIIRGTWETNHLISIQ